MLGKAPLNPPKGGKMLLWSELIFPPLGETKGGLPSVTCYYPPAFGKNIISGKKHKKIFIGDIKNSLGGHQKFSF